MLFRRTLGVLFILLGSATAPSAWSDFDYEVYLGTYSVLPDFDPLTPVETGSSATISTAVTGNTDNFALVFTNQLTVTGAGVYEFETTSDDGSKLYVDGELVVNNDGLHGAVTQNGSISLAAGTYELRVEYFERGGAQTLTVRYRANRRDFAPIPADGNLVGPREFDYAVYQGSFDLLPDFTSLTPVASGSSSIISTSVTTLTENFGLVFTHELTVPTPGTYEFETTSDDGSKLYINGTTVVDNDGLHAAQTRSGSIQLPAGSHSLRVEFFEKGGAESLDVRFRLAGNDYAPIPPNGELGVPTLKDVGEWGSVIGWPHIAISAANLPDGRVLTWSSTEVNAFPSNREFTHSAVFNPQNNSFVDTDNNFHDMFCAGVSSVEDGTIVASGGNPDDRRTSRFDPNSLTWSSLPEMFDRRWYATNVTLPTNEVFSTFGKSAGNRSEKLNYDSETWVRTPNATMQTLLEEHKAISGLEWFPQLAVQTNGRVFHGGPTPTLHSFDPVGGTQNQDLGRPTGDRARKWGNVVTYDVGKVLLVGGADFRGGPATLASNVYLADLNGPVPVVTQGPPMNFPRALSNSVTLPNGEVLVIGGNTSGANFSDGGSVFPAEIYDPVANNWRVVDSIDIPRNYHSTALLLKDGRVLSAGGGACGGCSVNHQDGQIYTPGYLYNEDGTAATRPTMNNVPAESGAGVSFTVNASADTVKFTMVRLSATTHHINTDQRFVPVASVNNGDGTHTLTLNANPNVLIAGNYWLFAVNADGTPSLGESVQVQRDFVVAPVDSDGDGVPDSEDAFPNDPTETADSDGDGVGDNADAFPNDATETTDSDGDGVGDNADAFPNDPNEAADSDGDGVGDNADAFPNDATETTDSDGDGVGDNADAFPNDPNESADSDGDGVGDNADVFPNDPTETKDSDGDGIGDNADPTPFGDFVFSDDFESASGWTINPNGTDTATTGVWEIANPDQTDISGMVMQLGDANGGTSYLVSGAAANGGAGGNDVDAGVTSIRSPDFDIATDGSARLSFSYYKARYLNQTADDFFRISVVGTTTQVLFEELGVADLTENSAWQAVEVDIDGFAGETVHLLIEVADAGTPSLVEAGVDDIQVTFEAIVDSDGDGVPDDEDAFPNDPTETRDTDGDGIGDNADPETFPLSFQYYRFTPVELRDDANVTSVQLSELQIFGENSLRIAGGIASNPGGNNPAGEGPQQALDGNTATKWLDANKGALVVDYGARTIVSGYRLVTANDVPGRDPVRWRVDGSYDGTTWTPVDDRSSAVEPVPASRATGSRRYTIAGYSEINLSTQDATLTGSFQLIDGDVLLVPQGTGEEYTFSETLSRADFAADVTSPGEYFLEGSVAGQNGSSDSFYVRVDGEPATPILWDTPSGEFLPVLIQNRGASEPFTVTLEAGAHTVSLYHREDDTRLNGLRLVQKTVDRAVVDSDGDGVPDADDAFPNDPTETTDTDGDGVGDNADAFPNDPAETVDSDGDGVGDNADAFPNDPSEVADSDGDGVGNNADAFPNDPNETADTDSDGVGDNADAFPGDPNETADSDGDGVGDNADAFPNDPSEVADSDGDGVGDNADAFPNDPNETTDSDGDGVGDNADAFPNDPSESADSDGDGVGDNADAFPNDPTETTDSDGDGAGDNSDAFPNDPTESADSDGDGVGDNTDAFPNDPSETADSDADGVGDNADAFPNDPTETSDRDGDGVGDNADAFPDDPTRSELELAPLPNGQPVRSSTLVYEANEAGDRLWNVNPDNDTVTVVDAAGNKLTEIEVGETPWALALSPAGDRVVVSNKAAATISVIDTATLAVVETVALAENSQPHGIVYDPDGVHYFVVLESLGRLEKRLSATNELVDSLEGPGTLRHVSMTADGATLFVSNFITPPLPGESGAVVDTSVGGGQVYAIEPDTLALVTLIELPHDDRPLTEFQGPGLPNYLFALTPNNAGTLAVVPSKKDNITSGTLRGGFGMNFDQTVRAQATPIDLGTLTAQNDIAVDFDNASVATSLAFSGDDRFVLVTLETSRELAVFDVDIGTEVLRLPTGRAPQSVVISDDGQRAYVHNFMSRSLSLFDLAAAVDASDETNPVLGEVSTVANEKLSAEVLVGKQHFYDAADPRLARDGYMSCASCHREGKHDGRTWDFTNQGEGVRNTISLRGKAGLGHGLLHWSGNFDEVQDFENPIRNFSGGLGLMSDEDFFAGTRSDTLGDPKAGLSPDLDALAAYVTSLDEPEIAPVRSEPVDDVVLRGAQRFEELNCASCHSGETFTDSATGIRHDIGTLTEASGQRLSSTLDGIDTPTLLSLFATAPYLHDGSAATIADAIAAHSGIALTGTDAEDIATALLRLPLDDEDPDPEPEEAEIVVLERVISRSGTQKLRDVVTIPPEAIRLTVTLSGGTGGADLFVGDRFKPKANRFTCSSRTEGTEEICVIEAPVEPGPFNILVTVGSVAGEYTNVTLRASYTVLTDEPPPPDNQAPVAAFTSTPTDLSVSFDASTSADVDGSVVDWQWAFGDGAIGSGETTSHSYASAGTYTVELTVTDDDGATNTVTAEVVVTDDTGGPIETVILVIEDVRKNAGRRLRQDFPAPAGGGVLVVTMGNGSGDADLYVKVGSRPRLFDFDCADTGPGNAHECTIATPAAGTAVHLLLEAISNVRDIDITVTQRIE